MVCVKRESVKVILPKIWSGDLRDECVILVLPINLQGRVLYKLPSIVEKESSMQKVAFSVLGFEILVIIVGEESIYMQIPGELSKTGKGLLMKLEKIGWRMLKVSFRGRTHEVLGYMLQFKSMGGDTATVVAIPERFFSDFWTDSGYSASVLVEGSYEGLQEMFDAGVISL